MSSDEGERKRGGDGVERLYRAVLVLVMHIDNLNSHLLRLSSMSVSVY